MRLALKAQVRRKLHRLFFLNDGTLRVRRRRARSGAAEGGVAAHPSGARHLSRRAQRVERRAAQGRALPARRQSAQVHPRQRGRRALRRRARRRARGRAVAQRLLDAPRSRRGGGPAAAAGARAGLRALHLARRSTSSRRPRCRGCASAPTRRCRRTRRRRPSDAQSGAHDAVAGDAAAAEATRSGPLPRRRPSRRAPTRCRRARSSFPSPPHASSQRVRVPTPPGVTGLDQGAPDVDSVRKQLIAKAAVVETQNLFEVLEHPADGDQGRGQAGLLRRGQALPSRSAGLDGPRVAAQRRREDLPPRVGGVRHALRRRAPQRVQDDARQAQGRRRRRARQGDEDARGGHGAPSRRGAAQEERLPRLDPRVRVGGEPRSAERRAPGLSDVGARLRRIRRVRRRQGAVQPGGEAVAALRAGLLLPRRLPQGREGRRPRATACSRRRTSSTRACSTPSARCALINMRKEKEKSGGGFFDRFRKPHK